MHRAASVQNRQLLQVSAFLGHEVGNRDPQNRGVDGELVDAAVESRLRARIDGSAQAPLGRREVHGQDLVRLHIMNRLGQMNTDRLKAAKASGGDIPGMANISKLAMSDMMRLSRDLGLQLVGPAGTLHAYTDEQRQSLDAATGNPMLAVITGTALYAQAPPIYGGTDQIQRNIIGERVLGLPKEPGDFKTTPFSELPKNA